MKTRRLRVLGAVALVAGTSIMAPRIAEAAELIGDINFLTGSRTADSDDWEPVHRSTLYGVESTWRSSEQPIGLAVDAIYFSSRERETETSPLFDHKALELAIGFRKIWEVKFLHPYFGAGFSYSFEEMGRLGANGRETIEDRTTGFWTGGGLTFRLARHLNLGVTARYTAGKNIQLGRSYDSSGVMAAVHVGVGWGGKQEEKAEEKPEEKPAETEPKAEPKEEPKEEPEKAPEDKPQDPGEQGSEG
jgi:hypothetical protein